MKESPGAETPWNGINQLLAPDERFALNDDQRPSYLLAPKHSSQLAALLYFLQQENIPFCVQGRGHEAIPNKEQALILSTRAFSQLIWHEHGIVEVGAGCSLSLLHQFLFERNQEVALEESLIASSKRSVAGVILSGKIAGLRYRGETFSEALLGIELVTWDGSQVKWGGVHNSPVAGPALHRLVPGLHSLPGIVVKVILKTSPIPPKRLRLAWSFRESQTLWQLYHHLRQFSTSWEYLEIMLAGRSSSQGFIFAQISGLPEEMEAFIQNCPGYHLASQQGERMNIKQFLNQEKLKAFLVDPDIALKPEEYLCIQQPDQKAWLFTLQQEKQKYQDSIWLQKWKCLEKAYRIKD